nr:hypothetical protein [Tanacetum cinerariifolium]
MTRLEVVGIKSLHEVTAVKVRVTAAKLNLVMFSSLKKKYANTARVKLVLLVKIEENILSSYYCLYTVNAAGVEVTTASSKLMLLVQVNAAERLQLRKDKDCLKIKVTYEIRIVIYTIDL